MLVNQIHPPQSASITELIPIFAGNSECPLFSFTSRCMVHVELSSIYTADSRIRVRTDLSPGATDFRSRQKAPAVSKNELTKHVVIGSLRPALAIGG